MNLDIIGRVAERKINEAIEEGAFANLPGKGQPLVFDDDPATPPHLRMANKVLKNAGVLPEWVQALKDLETERREVLARREKLQAENRKRRAHLENVSASHVGARQFAEWHTKSRADYLRRLKSANNTILKLSLLAPTTVQPPSPFRIADEMEAFDRNFPPLPQQAEIETAAPQEEKRSVLRSAARERYENGGGGPVGEWLRKARLLRPGSRDEIQTAQETHSEDLRISDAP